MFALGCLVAMPAAAQPSESPDQQTLHQVEELARQARGFYNEGRYDRAVAMYLEAYKLLPAAATLYNVAHIYDRKLDEPELAANFYRRYIRAPDADPKAVQRATRRIGQIKAAQESAPLELPVPPIRRDPAPVQIQRPVEPAAGGSTAAWVALGVGAAAIAGGAVMGTLASDRADRFRDLDEENRQGLRDQGRTQALTADILFGVGAIAVGTGVVLMVIGSGGDGEGLGLAPSGHGATASWRGHF